MSGSSRSSKRRRGGTAFPGRLALDGLGSPSHISHLSPSSHNRRANSIASSFAVTTPSSCASRSCSRSAHKVFRGESRAQSNQPPSPAVADSVRLAAHGEPLSAIVNLCSIDLPECRQCIVECVEPLDDAFTRQQPLQLGPRHASGTAEENAPAFEATNRPARSLSLQTIANGGRGGLEPRSVLGSEVGLPNAMKQHG